MSKVRIIPTLLTDNLTIVKGEEFNNWRSVGSASAAANLFSMRDVDELSLLDVTASKENRCISESLISIFAEVLQVPFSVGGGINTLELARKCLKAGAEKVVIGKSIVQSPKLVNQIANEFGTQAVIAAVDVVSFHEGTIRVNEKELKQIDLEIMLEELCEAGVGEILIQSVSHDGKMKGMNTPLISMASSLCDVPVIASSGAGSISHFAAAIDAGASAVAAGAIFQFTQNTPRSIRQGLIELGYNLRNS
jgi:cyclase